MSVLATGPDGMMHGALQVARQVRAHSHATDEGGRMATSPASGAIGAMAFHFAIDPQGDLWVKRQLRSTGEFLPWRPVGVTGLAAQDVMVSPATRGSPARGRHLHGQLRLGTFDGARVAGWTTVAEGAAGPRTSSSTPGERRRDRLPRD